MKLIQSVISPSYLQEDVHRLHPERPHLDFESRKGMDDTCLVTGAASIMAKVYRDRIIADLSSDRFQRRLWLSI